MPDIHSKYFKYYSVNENMLSVFIKREIWFSHPQSLNDPFDLNMDCALLLEAAKKYVEPETFSHLQWWFENEVFLLPMFRVFCATSVFDDPVMWGHYADGHRGICVGYNLNSWNLGPDSPITVSYNLDSFESAIKDVAKLLESDSWRDSDASASHAARISHAWATTKSSQWEYERELRFLAPGVSDFPGGPTTDNGVPRSIIPSDVDCVLFGLKTPQRSFELVRSLLSGNEWQHVTQWKATHHSSNPFGLVFENLN